MSAEGSNHLCVRCGLEFISSDPNASLCQKCSQLNQVKSVPGQPDVPVKGSIPQFVKDETQPRFPTDESWSPGQVLLDTYEVKDVLGEGGMGTVYRVHHNAWNLDLALKQPKPDVVAQAGVETFVNEAQTWVDLGLHPHIATCHYVRKIDELPCVFAELVEGGSLADWIKKGKLRKLEDMLDVAIQFAWGLHYAHELGMIHQDVKPANVLMKEDGVTKVTDFGLVKAGLKGRTISSGKGTILAEWAGGTQAYFSPEQSTWIDLASQAQQWAEAGEKELSDKLRQQTDLLPKPTRRTDLWSWGLCVLEMFNGKRSWAYGSAALESLETCLERGPAVAGLPAMPPVVGELLLACFREDPTDRPHDMQVVAEKLMRVYENAAGKPYPRQQPRAVDLRADSLNNKALSMLDLGKEDEAVGFWQRALKIDIHHTEATYNLGLWRWQAAQQIDLDLVQQLEAVIRTQTDAWMPYYLLGLVHIQRRDIPAARQSLEEAERLSPGVEQVLAAIRRLDEVSSMGFLRTLQGHEGYVRAVAITPDGQQIVSGGYDNTLRVWDLASGKCLHTLEGHIEDVTIVAITQDGRQVVSGSFDNMLRVWDLESGECLRILKGHAKGVSAVAILPDGRQVVSGSLDNTLRVWNLVSGECLRTLEGHTGGVTVVATSPDGQQVVSGSADKTLRVWDLESGECLRTLGGHTFWVNAVAISPNGRQVVSGSYDNTLRVWDLASGECLRTLEGHTSFVQVVLITLDGRYVVSGSADNTLRVWDLASGECLHTLEGHTSWVKAVAITPDRRQVVSGSSDNTLRVWDLVSGECLRTLEGHTRDVDAVVVSPDGQQVISGGNYATGVCVWQLSAFDQKTVEWAVSRPRDVLDVQAAAVTVQQRLETARLALQSGQVREAAKALREALRVPGFERDSEILTLWNAAGRRAGHSSGLLWVHMQHTLKNTNSVKAVAITPDGRQVFSSSNWDDILRVWDLESGECLHTLEGHTESVLSVAVTPDGRQVVFGGEDYTLRVWDLAGGERLRTLEGQTSLVTAIAITPDGRRVVSGSDVGTLWVWNLASGECLRTLEGHTDEVSAIAITLDGQRLVSGSEDYTLRVWDMESGECLRILEGHTYDVYAVAITPDGRQIVSGSGDYTLRVWDMESGECLRILEGTDVMTAVAISPDGHQVVSGSRDNTLRVWDMESGECLRSLEGHIAGVNAVVISPDGRQVVSGSDDETLRVWNLDWDYGFPDPADWNEGARPYLEIFLILHTPYGLDGFTRLGPPVWNEAAFQQLLVELGYRGYGWLRSEGVRKKLEEMAKGRA
jgi:WD40 repeat protein/serine/threonine protein kinase